MENSDIHNKLSVFKDLSTDCAICLTPLKDKKVIELSCGHRWHLECIEKQLQHAQPDFTKRLLFSGCRCAKCGHFCDHESLRHLTRKIDKLRTKVDALILEQLRIEKGEKEKDEYLATSAVALEDGRTNKYAFYLCKSCEEPYFGGTINCADNVEEDVENNNDRLCPSCSIASQSIECRHPLEHRSFHLWKCRYCCQPAQYVCYGTVHFCSSCHDRNSHRVQQQQQDGRRRGNKISSLEPIPCKGKDCPFPKKNGQEYHFNGLSSSCEQVYQCILCNSSNASSIENMLPGSRNFIKNPNGEYGLHGWRQLGRNNNSNWRVETSEIPLQRMRSSSDNDNEEISITTNFVSSFQWGVIGQSIPLYKFIKPNTTASTAPVRIEASAYIMGRTDCPSVFQMEIVVMNHRRMIIQRKKSEILVPPVDYWEKTCIFLDIPLPHDDKEFSPHELMMILYGKDQNFWQGYYGAKVTDCSVRVLGSSEELEDILNSEDEAVNDAVDQNLATNDNNNLFRSKFWDIFAPVLILFFLWLFNKND